MAGGKSDYQKGAEARRQREGGTSSVAAEKSDAEHASALEREKFDPALRGERLSADQVQAAGGLGALARARGAKSAGDAGEALARRKKAGEK